MRFNSPVARTVVVSALAGAAALFSGCQTSPSDQISDEFAQISSQEVSNMSANSSTMIGSLGSAAKEAAGVAGDTIYYDWKLHPYSWDPMILAYVRSATFDNLSDGYARLRTDTLTFKDAAGNSLQYPTLATVKTIAHIRDVTRTKGGNALNIRIDMNSVINLAPDTTHVKNGTITGTYDGDQVGTGTITNVTRQYTNSHWQFPSSGQIAVDFPRRSYDVEFLGGGDARLTITNKTTDKTRVITVHVDEK
jgi:hypothetical protein